MGAATLAARACLRSGAGLLTLYIPKCGYAILQNSIPEAMLICDKHEKMITAPIPLDKFNALGIGCGIGTTRKTSKALKQLIQSFDKPMVIDADAINIISENKDYLKWVPANSIFTPHAIEFERLVGKASNENEKRKMQIDFSQKYQVYVVLKGHQTAISCPNGNSFLNTTGNAGMAKGGSGDALTGMLTAFLAQAYSPEQACIAGVYLHGLAGDIAVKETGECSLLASDLINAIGKAFLEVMQERS
jgi:NAD(P)H-hydrate epimerase